MLGFGRKKVAMRDVVSAFYQETALKVRNSLPTIREALDGVSDASFEAVEDEVLYAEMFSATLAIGLQPVRNLWDSAAFERARRELVRVVEGHNEPEVSYYLKLRMDEYLTAWLDADPSKGSNMPWDEVTGGVLANLGVGRTSIGDIAVIDPIAIIAVSSILVTLPGMFWKNVEKNFRLS